MIFLSSFSPFQPTPGLALWSLIIFVGFWMIMKKYAFKPMMEGLKTREDNIQSALDEAAKAREEMSNLKAENEQILSEAREERARMLSEAKEMKTSIINDAKAKAKNEATKIVEGAQQEIENQKNTAIAEVKKEVGLMAVDIAERILQKNLSNDTDQMSYVKDLVTKMSSN